MAERYKYSQSNTHKSISNKYDGNFQPNTHSNQIPGPDFNSPHGYIDPNLMPSDAYFNQGDKIIVYYYLENTYIYMSI